MFDTLERLTKDIVSMHNPDRMNLEELLKLKGEYDDFRKRRSMVFQVSSKEEAAAAFGKPFDFYYHFSYEQWSKISRRLVEKREKVMRECIDRGIPGDMPFSDFPYYCEQMGLTTVS